MSQQASASEIRDRFISWVKPREHYLLYYQILEALPEVEPFWLEIAQHIALLDGARRKFAHYSFMAAVQYVALENPSEPLTKFFPASPTHDAKTDRSKISVTFLDFYQRRKNKIWRLVQTREVQINKLGRLALLAPLFLEVAKRVRGPLAFVDVGCSVGFGMLWEHFVYHYPEYGRIRGKLASSELCCKVKGLPPISFEGDLPKPSFLAGIETSPITATREEDVRWLLALTAPGNKQGRDLLQAGLQLAASVKLEIRYGCVLDVLPVVENEIPPTDTLVIYHSMTLHHLRADGKEQRLQNLLSRLSSRRQIFEISIEWSTPKQQVGRVPVEVSLCHWHNGIATNELVAETDDSADGDFLKFR